MVAFSRNRTDEARRPYVGAWHIRVTQEILLNEAARVIDPSNISAEGAPAKLSASGE